jgi:putative ABC transport system permease protein
MQSLLQDLRYALRQLRKSPGFGGAVIVTLALSIGITAAIFSVLYAMLIRPLPYQHPESIVSVETKQIQGYTQWAAYPEYLDWRKMSHSFSALAGYQPYGTVNFEGSKGPIALNAVQGTDNFLDVFGVRPILGRTFAPAEDQPGKNDVVVLSYEVWQQNFGGDPAAVGRQAKIDGRPYTIIGVMPAGFRFPIGKVDAVYTPLHVPERLRDDRGDHWLQTIARLKPGVTAQQAKAELTGIMNDLGRTDQFNSGRSVKMVDLESYVVGNTNSSLHLLLYAVLALLAIGCVNVAGLMLARGVKREREVALRSALGARKSRIMQQMLIEALLFAFCGALGGIMLGYGLLHVIRLLLVSALSRGAGSRAEYTGAARSALCRRRRHDSGDPCTSLAAFESRANQGIAGGRKRRHDPWPAPSASHIRDDAGSTGIGAARCLRTVDAYAGKSAKLRAGFLAGAHLDDRGEPISRTLRRP